MTLDKPVSGGRGGAASPIEFRLDPASGVPTYQQLVRQVEQALLLGYLNEGDQLPKVRDVVAELAINPNTVLKAYRELEHKGIASGRPGQGTFVEVGAAPTTLPELTRLRRRLRDWLGDAHTAGLDEERVVALFTLTLRDFPTGRPASEAGGGRASGGVA